MSQLLAVVDIFGEREGKTGASGYSHVGVEIDKELGMRRRGIQRAEKIDKKRKT